MAKILEMEVLGDTAELQKAESVQAVEEPELESPDYADADDLIDAAVLEGAPDPRAQEFAGEGGPEEPLGSRFTEEYREFLKERYGDGETEGPEGLPEDVPGGEGPKESEELSEAVSAVEAEEAAETEEAAPEAEELPCAKPAEEAAETEEAAPAAEDLPEPEPAEDIPEEKPEAPHETSPVSEAAPQTAKTEEKGIRGLFRKTGSWFRRKK